MKIIVSSLALAPEIMTREQPSHLVSLLAPEDLHLAPAGHAPDRHLRIGMHDLRDLALAEPGSTPPQAVHVDEILAFADRWSGAAPLLVHCWAGISRSTATAFTIACARNPRVDEIEIALALRAASPTAAPNPVLVGYADAALGRRGRMLAAIAAMGEPAGWEGARPFHLPAELVRVK